MDSVDGVKTSEVETKAKIFVFTSERPKNDWAQNFVNFLKI